jgi:predicted site-specific integrase-resolvase
MNDLLSIADVCQLVGCSIDSLRKWMRAGRFPRPTHQRGRNKFWTREVVETAITGLTRRIES